MSLTIAVTGMNATDNPGPGVGVIRSVRAAAPGVRIVGLAYDVLDPGNYMGGIADHVYMVPYPSQGAAVLLRRLRSIHARTPIDVLIPSLDSELAAYIKLRPALHRMGIRTMLPREATLRLREKSNLHELNDLGIAVPHGVAINDASAIASLGESVRYPVMVKGRFYGAEIAYTPAQVRHCFDRMAAKWGVPVIVQEFVSGNEYDVVCVGDGEGGLVGSVPMRKMQLTDKGKAWGGVTVSDSDLDDFVAHAMASLRWRGPCELEIMRSSDDGSLWLIEINPRFPAWVYLSVGAGRNLPWATVRLALGLEVEPMAPAPPGVMFLRHSSDQICRFTDYESLTTLGELHRTSTSNRHIQAVSGGQEVFP